MFLLPDLRLGEEVVVGEQDAEDEAHVSVKKSGAEEVVVAEPDERTERQAQIEALDPALEGNGLAGALGAFVEFSADEVIVEIRLPVRIAVMLFDETVDRRVGVVLDAVLERLGPSVDDQMLVNLHVADILRRAGAGRHLLEMGGPVFDESRNPQTRIAAMTDGAAEEHVEEVEPIGVDAFLLVFDRLADFVLKRLREHLVRIDQQHPLVADRQVVERPVLLLGVDAVEMELDDFRALRFGELDRTVGRLAVDDEHLVRPIERTNALDDVQLLILRRNDNGNGNFAHNATY